MQYSGGLISVQWRANISTVEAVQYSGGLTSVQLRANIQYSGRLTSVQCRLCSAMEGKINPSFQIPILNLFSTARYFLKALYYSRLSGC